MPLWGIGKGIRPLGHEKRVRVVPFGQDQNACLQKPFFEHGNAALGRSQAA